MPTQWTFVDITRDHRVKSWISPQDKINAIDHLIFPHEEFSSHNLKDLKKQYKTLRSNFLEQFDSLYDKGYVSTHDGQH